VEFLLYAIAFFIGVSLGVIGAGGAIVAVPAFVYLALIPPKVAGGYALAIVAVATAISTIRNTVHGHIEWRAVPPLAICTMLGVFATRTWLMPALPVHIAVGGFGMATDSALMMLFAVVLVVIGLRMMTSSTKRATHIHMPTFIACGLAIGVLSGLLGVGGGFLITPLLVMHAGIAVKRAVSTSLVLICLNSIVGVVGDIAAGTYYDWYVLAPFIILTALGIITGMAISHRLDHSRVKYLYAWFVILLGIAVMGKELHILFL
jgi:uncharacterized protein